MSRPPDDTLPNAANEAAPTRPALSGRRLVIRADGDSRIGVGHVMRCLALTQSWIGFGGQVRLACTAVPPAIAERYHDEGAEIVLHERWPPEELIEDAAAVVADGLDIRDADLAAVAAAGVPLAIVDDMAHRAHYPGALLVNQNLHATPALYAGKTAAQLCLGPRFGLLRREFRSDTTPQPAVGETVRRLLVLMGGADPKGYSRVALEATARTAESLPGDAEIILVVGAANPAADDLQHRATGLAVRVDIRRDVRDMAALLGTVDLAISAAGSTVLEMAALGVPMIIGAQNESEVGPAAALSRRGAAVDVGPLEHVDATSLAETVTAVAGDPDRRRALSANARTLVDGFGADRVAAAIADVISDTALTPDQPRNS
ncbi:MAG: glycosyltransferase [Thalassobaculaceae bacterium]